MNPSVIAVDVEFSDMIGGEGDRELAKALRLCRSLVLPTIVESRDGQIWMHSANETVFRPFHAKSGFVSGEYEDDPIEALAKFPIQLKSEFGKEPEFHISVTTAMVFDSLQTAKFIKEHENIVKVDFKNGNRRFKRFSGSEVIQGKVSKSDIEGKIVMLGYLGPKEIDKFYSPLNKEMKKPDMYGLEFLANIVAQILEYE